MKRTLRWSSKVYRMLVNAYPKHFLADYADELVWCFEKIITVGDLNYFSQVHHSDSMADLSDNSQVVSDKQIRKTILLLQVHK